MSDACHVAIDLLYGRAGLQQSSQDLHADLQQKTSPLFQKAAMLVAEACVCDGCALLMGTACKHTCLIS